MTVDDNIIINHLSNFLWEPLHVIENFLIHLCILVNKSNGKVVSKYSYFWWMREEQNTMGSEENTLACTAIVRDTADHRDTIISKQILGSIDQIQRFKNISKYLNNLNLGFYSLWECHLVKWIHNLFWPRKANIEWS